MPIKIPNGIPAADILDQESIFYMTEDRAFHQDIRPLKLLLVNLMPTKETTEAQFFRLLGNSALQVDIKLVHTASYQPTHVSRSHLEQFYVTFEDIQHQTFDGMIITGAPVETLPFEAVEYWPELCQIMAWSQTHVYSTLHVCWGAQAGLYYHYGIEKRTLPQKVFGVYAHQLASSRAIHLFRGFDDIFYVPHSRHTDIDEAAVLRHPDLDILCTSPESGIFAIEGKGGRQIFLTGHVEYDPYSLKAEYDRDIAKGMAMAVPENYYPDDDPTKPPIVKWRSCAHLLFANWLNYYVYQETPFDLTAIQNIAKI